MIKKHNDKWIWGKDNTGDILNTENIIWFRDYFKDPNRKLDLITGDAGLPDNELFIYQKLDYSQFLLLISCAFEGTNAVIKTFIPFMRTKSDSEDSDGYYVGLMYLYSLFFKEIHLYKPYTSRPSSGEYYIICKHFNSTCLTDDIYNKLINIHKNFVINQTFFKHNDIPDKFIVQLYNWIDNLASYNIKALERSYFFISCINDDDENIKKINNCDKLLDSKYIKEIKDKRYAAWWSLFSNPN
jgi:cap2 methyltransferase